MTAPPPPAQLLTYAARLVRAVGQAAAGESPAVVRLLARLDELGPVTVTALARRDASAQPTTSATVRAMEERGLVSRPANPGDARSTLVALTELGRQELDAAHRRHAAVVERLLAERGVSAGELETAVAVLRALTDPPA